jgi:hypothetical protein
MSNRDTFARTLSGQYVELFQSPGYAMAKARYTPDALAQKMTDGLADGTANKDGDGIIRTCKLLKLPHTYKAIRAYLQAV